MADRNANRPQLDFPQLTADIIRQLRLTGQIGLLEFSDQVAPVYIVAQREGALDLVTNLPAFTSASMVDGSVFDPVAGTVIVDTGPLPAGTYDIFGSIRGTGVSLVTGATIELEHRNAANAATLAVLLNGTLTTGTGFPTAALPLIGYVLALNERLRIITDTSLAGQFAGVIGTLIRPTP